MSAFQYQELLPAGHHDDTPFRLLTSDGVSTFEAACHTKLATAASNTGRAGDGTVHVSKSSSDSA